MSATRGLGLAQSRDDVDYEPKSNDPIYDVPWDKRYDGPAQNAPKTQDFDRAARADAQRMFSRYRNGPPPEQEVEQWKSRWRKQSGRYGFRTDDDMARLDRMLADILDDGGDNW